MSTYREADFEKAALQIYNKTIATYSLGGAFKVTRRVRDMLTRERLRRKALPLSERCLDEVEDTIKDKIKIKTKSKKAKKKTAGVFASLCVLFDKNGVDKVTYADAKKCAKQAKPDSNLSSGHYRWYIKQYKKRNKK